MSIQRTVPRPDYGSGPSAVHRCRTTRSGFTAGPAPDRQSGGTYIVNDVKRGTLENKRVEVRRRGDHVISSLLDFRATHGLDQKQNTLTLFRFCSKRSFKVLPQGSKVQSFPPAEGGILLLTSPKPVCYLPATGGGVPLHVALMLFVFYSTSGRPPKEAKTHR